MSHAVIIRGRRIYPRVASGAGSVPQRAVSKTAYHAREMRQPSQEIRVTLVLREVVRHTLHTRYEQHHVGHVNAARQPASTSRSPRTPPPPCGRAGRANATTTAYAPTSRAAECRRTGSTASSSRRDSRAASPHGWSPRARDRRRPPHERHDRASACKCPRDRPPRCQRRRHDAVMPCRLADRHRARTRHTAVEIT